MKSFIEKIIADAERYGLSRPIAWIVIAFPFILTFIFALFLTIPSTRRFWQHLLAENQPVEILTAIFLLAASPIAFLLMRHHRRTSAPLYITAFYGLVAVALFVIGMEEIAWGQWILGFETPEGLRQLNEQDEVTIHNIQGLHGRTEFLRIIFGIGGLVGIAVASFKPFRKISPPFFLIGWFLLIAGLTVPDLWNDFYEGNMYVDSLFIYLSELNEFFIALASFIFLWVMLRHWKTIEG